MQLPKPLVLASSSQRRSRILREQGLQFEVRPPTVAEIAVPNDPQETAYENALRKHTWGRNQSPECLIVAADTVIDLDGRLIGKPGSREEAAAILRVFSGRDHRVITALALTGTEDLPEIHLATSLVRFLTLSEADIQGYLAAVDPMDKAGGYDIAEHGASIIAGYGGSWTNIMGLPVEPLTAWLKRWGGV